MFVWADLCPSINGIMQKYLSFKLTHKFAAAITAKTFPIFSTGPDNLLQYEPI
jgi:hypothetical protein